jgi:hypothetical protein
MRAESSFATNKPIDYSFRREHRDARTHSHLRSIGGKKRTEVTDFARFLLAQQDDERWEELLDDPRPRPKLEAFVRESLAEGIQPLDIERL